MVPTGVFSSIKVEVPSISTQELTNVEYRSFVISTFAQQSMNNTKSSSSCPAAKTQSGWAFDFLTEEQVHELVWQGWCPTLAFDLCRHVASCVGSTMRRHANPTVVQPLQNESA